MCKIFILPLNDSKLKRSLDILITPTHLIACAKKGANGCDKTKFQQNQVSFAAISAFAYCLVVFKESEARDRTTIGSLFRSVLPKIETIPVPAIFFTAISATWLLVFEKGQIYRAS